MQRSTLPARFGRNGSPRRAVNWHSELLRAGESATTGSQEREIRMAVRAGRSDSRLNRFRAASVLLTTLVTAATAAG
jgi:hypothetical protein